MATINATMFPADAKVLVEVLAGDVVGATCVQVRRVIDATGDSAPLRTYVYPCSIAGEYQHLSGGNAVFWDTEAPLDVPFHYEATFTDASGSVMNAPGADIVLYDTANRVVVNGWGAPNVGPAYLNSGATLQVAGDQLRFSQTAGNFSDQANPVEAVNVDYTFDFDDTAGTGAGSTSYQALVRSNAAFTTYLAFRIFHTALAAPTLGLREVRDNVELGFVGFPAPTGAPASGDPFRVRIQADGNVFRAKAWAFGLPEPTDWLMTYTVQSVLASGRFYWSSSINAGWTNAPPILTAFDNIYVLNLDLILTPLLVSTGPMTLASVPDVFWLRDPVRPCNDRKLMICWDDDVECVPGQGIFFAAMRSPETFAANSVNLLPTNARRPVPIARQMRDADSELTLVTRTFTDRDAVLETAQPGSPLLFQAPPVYGIPDRYMSVTPSISVARGITDHRYQPRLLQLPYTTVDRPVGPSRGICGSRFMDLCDDYPTWDAAEATGLAWSTLVTGDPAELGFETWGDVLATFGTWTNVLAHGTWLDVRNSP